MPPGIASRTKISRSTFSRCQCETPEARVVPISAAWTAADATAADAPRVSRRVELVKPKPIPSEPSTNCATEPARAKSIQFIEAHP